VIKGKESENEPVPAGMVAATAKSVAMTLEPRIRSGTDSKRGGKEGRDEQERRRRRVKEKRSRNEPFCWTVIAIQSPPAAEGETSNV